jgi:DNA adenine methylase
MRLKYPLLRYPGSKFRLAESIIRYGGLNRAKLYAEPFCGAANVLLQKSRSPVEIINDFDSAIVGILQAIRDRPRSFFNTVYSYVADEATFNRLYPRFRRGYPEVDFFVLNTWFPGTDNESRTFLTKCDQRQTYENKCLNLPNIHLRLKGVKITHMHAHDFIKQYSEPEMVFYCDPPYVGKFKYAVGYGVHRELVDILSTVDSKFVVSHYNHPLFDQLGWPKVELHAYTSLKTEDNEECLYISKI